MLGGVDDLLDGPLPDDFVALRLKAADGDDSGEFECLKTALRSHGWVVYTKAPFADAGQVLAYLGRLHPGSRRRGN